MLWYRKYDLKFNLKFRQMPNRELLTYVLPKYFCFSNQPVTYYFLKSIITT